MFKPVQKKGVLSKEELMKLRNKKELKKINPSVKLNKAQKENSLKKATKSKKQKLTSAFTISIITPKSTNKVKVSKTLTSSSTTTLSNTTTFIETTTTAPTTKLLGNLYFKSISDLGQYLNCTNYFIHIKPVVQIGNSLQLERKSYA